MLKFFIIYSFIVTVALLFSIWIIVRTTRDRSEDFGRTERELQDSRATVSRVRKELGECRRILSEGESGLDGVINRLRAIAKEVAVLEDIVNNRNPS